jgi:ABC-2 type transport system ATP-binding protein
MTDTQPQASDNAAIDFAIHTIHLRKEYTSRGRAGKEKFVAVADLNLKVPKGQVFGFLGPNGAGKTTTINMLLGNVHPSGGDGRLLGAELGDVAIRGKVGFLPEKFQFHEFLSAEEFLDVHGKLYGMCSAERKASATIALERVGLADRRKDKLGEFSKGMQQRAGLAQAILNQPELVILDEPTSALDPLGRRDVRTLISDLKAEGVTVFLNSHLLSEIEMTCDQVAIIKQGVVVRQGSVHTLLAASTTVEMAIDGLTDTLLKQLQDAAAGPIDNRNGVLVIPMAGGDGQPDLAKIVVESGARLQSLVPVRESLEDLFIRTVEDKGVTGAS